MGEGGGGSKRWSMLTLAVSRGYARVPFPAWFWGTAQIAGQRLLSRPRAWRGNTPGVFHVPAEEDQHATRETR